MTPSIAIGITYYNEKQLLTELLQSIINQAEMPDEILIYDDNSELSAEKFIPKGIKLRVMRSETNCGPAHGRNQLLLVAKSDYIHFHDSDDLFLPQWTSRIRQVLAKDAVDALFTEVLFQKPGGETSGSLGLSQLVSEPDLLRFCIRGAMLVPAGTYRRRHLLATGGYPASLSQSEDYAFHIKLAAQNVAYTIIEEPLVVVRLRPDGRSRTDPVGVYRDGLQALSLIKDEVPDTYRTEIADAAIRFSRALFQLGDISGARKGFRCAHALGKPSYRYQPRSYRWAASSIGPMGAEYLGSVYRKLLRRSLPQSTEH